MKLFLKGVATRNEKEMNKEKLVVIVKKLPSTFGNHCSCRLVQLHADYV